MKSNTQPQSSFQRQYELPGMRGRVNTGVMANNGASATWGRPGNSAAEKFRAFSGRDGDKRLPSMSSLPVTLETRPLVGGTLSVENPSLRDSSQYKTIRTLETVDNNLQQRSSDDANRIDTNVYIGNSTSAQNIEWLISTGITNIINTAAEIPNYFAEMSPKFAPKYKLRYFNLSLKDDPTPGDEDLLAVLERTYRYMSGIIRFNPQAKILVHCHMGKSRSASVVIYYLMRSRGWSFDEALAFAQSKRSIVSPNAWYTRQLRDAEILLASLPRTISPGLGIL